MRAQGSFFLAEDGDNGPYGRHSRVRTDGTPFNVVISQFFDLPLIPVQSELDELLRLSDFLQFDLQLPFLIGKLFESFSGLRNELPVVHTHFSLLGLKNLVSKLESL